MGFGDDRDAPVRRRVARVRVVIAADQQDVEPRVTVAPGPERDVERRHAAGGGVQEIAQHHQARGARAIEEGGEPR